MFVQSFGYPIASISKQDKGLFGYKYVDFTLTEILHPDGHTSMAWIGSCSDPGLIRCRVGSALANMDGSEQIAVDRLLELAEREIDSGNFIGESIMRVQVNGETTVRVYTVSWNCDEKGDGNITVDRQDV
jgi:hypothetical protein